MRVEIRAALLKARMESDWEECGALIRELAMDSSDAEASCLYLYGSEQIAHLCGMPGMKVEFLYQALMRYQGDASLWLYFANHTRQSRNTGLMASALHRQVELAVGAQQKSVSLLYFGQFLQQQANDHRESANAYLRSGQICPDYALSALIALQRLHRNDPLCREAESGIAVLRHELNISLTAQDEVQAKFRAINPQDEAGRGLALIELARVNLQLWGDTSRAIDWLVEASQLAPQAVDELTSILLLVGRSMSDNMPTLRKICEIMIGLSQWHQAIELLELSMLIAVTSSDRVTILMSLAKVYGLHLDDSEASARCIYNAAMAGRDDFIQSMGKADWVFDMALSDPHFRAVLLAVLESLGDEALWLNLLEMLETRGTSEVLRESAALTRFRTLRAIRMGDREALRQLRQLIASFSTAGVVAIYEEILFFSGKPEYEKQILELAENIYAKSQDCGLYIRFLRLWSEAGASDLIRVDMSLRLAQLHLEAGDSEHAASAYLKVLDLDMGNADAHAFLATYGILEGANVDMAKLAQDAHHFRRQNYDDIFMALLSYVSMSNRALQLLSKFSFVSREKGVLRPDEAKLSGQVGLFTTNLVAILRQYEGEPRFWNRALAMTLHVVSQSYEYSPVIEVYCRTHLTLLSHDRLLSEALIGLCTRHERWGLLREILALRISQEDDASLAIALKTRYVGLLYFTLNDMLAAIRFLFQQWRGTGCFEEAHDIIYPIFSELIKEGRIHEMFENMMLAIDMEIADVSDRHDVVERLAYHFCSADSSFFLPDDILLIFVESLKPLIIVDGFYRLIVARIYDKVGRQEDSRELYESVLSDPSSQPSEIARCHEALMLLAVRDGASHDELEGRLKALIGCYEKLPKPDLGVEQSLQAIAVSDSDVQERYRRFQSLLKRCVAFGKYGPVLAQMAVSIKDSEIVRRYRLLKLIIDLSKDSVEYLSHLHLLQGAWCELHAYCLDEAKNHYIEVDKANVKDLRSEAHLGLLRISLWQEDWHESLRWLLEIYRTGGSPAFNDEAMGLGARALLNTKKPSDEVMEFLDMAFDSFAEMPEFLKIWHDFAQVHQISSAWVDRVLSAVPRLLDRAIRAMRYCDIARVQCQELSDYSGGMKTYFMAILSDPTRLEIWEALSLAAAECQDYWLLSQFYKESLDNPEMQAHRQYFLMQLAELYVDRLNDPEVAFNMCHELVSISVEHSNFCESVMLRAVTRYQRFDLLMRFYAIFPDAFMSAEAKAARFINLADAERSDDELSVSAINALSMSLVLNPSDRSTFKRLIRTLDTTGEQWRIVAEIITKYEAYSPSSPTLLQIAAGIYADRLNSPEEGFGVLSQAMVKNIHNQGFFQQIVMLSERTNQHRQLLAMLDDAIVVYSGDIVQKNALYAKKFQVADILGDDRIKLMCLKEILETTPEDPFALEQLYKMNPAHLKAHAQILLCQLQVYVSQDTTDRLEKQLQLASLYQRSSQFNNAINLYHSIIDERPDLLLPRYNLLELLLKLENWKSAENVLLALINLEKDSDKRFLNLVQLAMIQDEKMLMPSRALLTLFSAIDTAPRLNDLHRRMCEIASRLSSFSPLIDKYEDIVKHSLDQATRKAAAIHLANIYIEHLQTPAQACQVLDGYFEASGASDIEFMRMLPPFYSEMGHWSGYLRVLQRLADVSPDTEEKIRSCITVARYFITQADDAKLATYYAKQAMEYEPTRSEEWIEIAHIFLALDELKSAQTAYQYAAELQTGQDKAVTLFQLSQLLAELDELDSALNVFNEAVELNPSLELVTPVAENLISLATVKRDQNAFEVLCNTLVDMCPPSESVSLLLQQALTLARIFDDPPAVRRLVDLLAQVSASFDLDQSCMFADILTLLGDCEQAIDHNQNILLQYELDDDQRYDRLQTMLVNVHALGKGDLIRYYCEQILKLDDVDPNANFQLIQLDYHSGRWDQASKRIQQFLPYFDRLNPENAMLLYYYYGDVLRAAEQNSLAIESLDSALRIRMDFRLAVDLKLTILIEEQRWPEALPIFELLLKLSDEAEVKGAIHKRIGEIHHFYMHDHIEAIRHYELALTLGGDVEDVPIRLLQLYQLVGLWNKAAMTARVLASAQTASTHARVAYLLVLGEINIKQIGELNEASNTYLEAFSLDPLNDEIIVPLSRLLLRRRDQDNIQAVFDHICTHIVSDFQAASKTLLTMATEISISEISRTLVAQAISNMPAVFGTSPRVMKLIRDLELINSSDTSRRGSPSGLHQRPATEEMRMQIRDSGSLTYDSSLIKRPDDISVKRHDEISIVGDSSSSSKIASTPENKGQSELGNIISSLGKASSRREVVDTNLTKTSGLRDAKTVEKASRPPELPKSKSQVQNLQRELDKGNTDLGLRKGDTDLGLGKGDNDLGLDKGDTDLGLGRAKAGQSKAKTERRVIAKQAIETPIMQAGLSFVPQESKIFEANEEENRQDAVLEPSYESKKDLGIDAFVWDDFLNDEYVPLQDLDLLTDGDVSVENIDSIAMMMEEAVSELPEMALTPTHNVLESLERITAHLDEPKQAESQIPGIELPKLSTANIVLPQISSLTSSGIVNPFLSVFEKHRFGSDDILKLAKTARDEGADLTERMASELAQMAGLDIPSPLRIGLPSSIPDTVRQNLLSGSTKVISPNLVKLLSALAGAPDSPCLRDDDGVRRIDLDKHPALSDTFDGICQILRLPGVDIVQGPQTSAHGQVVINTYPPAIFAYESELATIQLSAWIAQMTYGLFLTRPEYILCASMPSAELYLHLERASISINPLRTRSADIDQDLAARYKAILIRSKFSAINMPRITRDTLVLLEQHLTWGKQAALQCSLHLTQSLNDTLDLISLLEGTAPIRGIEDLKRGMKISKTTQNLVMYAIGNQAQRTHMRMFSKTF